MECEDPSKSFKESFYDSRLVVKSFHNKIKNVHQILSTMHPEIVKFSIYGEYFGGSYPEIDSDYKQVQKGVSYIPHH